MENLLSASDFISKNELEYLETKYRTEQESGTVNPDTEFANHSSDRKRGIALLKGNTAASHNLGLSRTCPDRERDCEYFMALGHFLEKDYHLARKSINELIKREPENQQAISLKETIEKKARNEGLLGMALVGGVAVAAFGTLYSTLRARK